jgi:hypothetical protein
MSMDRTLFELSVKESGYNRAYWLKQPWLEVRLDDVRAADVLVVPWENFRPEQPALFPLGSGDLVRSLREMGALTFEFAIDEDQYGEILLHSKATRLPAMIVTSLMLPALAGMLGNLMSDLVQNGGPKDAVEMRVIVEGDHGRCIAIDYRGPPSRAVDALVTEAERCLPKPLPPEHSSQGRSPQQPKTVHHHSASEVGPKIDRPDCTE